MKIDDGSGNKFNVKKKSDGIVLEAQQQNQLFGSIELKNPKLYTDIDIKVDGANVKVNKLKATVTEDVYTSLGYKGSVKNGSTNNTKQWYLGHKTCPIKEGFNVDIILYIQLDVNGEFSVKTKTSATIGVNYKNNKMNTIHTSNFTPYEVKSEVGGSLGFDARLNIRFGGYWDEQQQKSQWAVDIIGFEGFLGPAFKVNTTSHATKPKVCQNVNIYLSLNLKISDFGIYNVLKAMKLSLEWKVLDDNASNPFRFAWHIEDGEKVNSCTFGKDDKKDDGKKDDDKNEDDTGSIEVESALKDNWKYTLDKANKTVNLVDYIGTSPDVVVHGSYLVGGQKYGTELTSIEHRGADGTNNYSSFYGNQNIKSVKIEQGVFSRDTSSMFDGCSGLTSLDVSGLNTSNVTNMSNMFTDCSGLISLDMSGLDASNVRSMGYMFAGCKGLTSLDMSGWNTSNVLNMAYMFAGCKGLTSLDVSGWNTSNVLSMEYMFADCKGLTSLDVSGLDTSNVTDMSWMFADCSNLTTITVSNLWVTDQAYTTDMFRNCGTDYVTYL